MTPGDGRVKESRIEAARRRAAGAKELAVAVAVAGFIAALLLARAGHPGHAKSSSGSSGSSQSSSRSQSQSGDDGFDFGSSSAAPSTGGGGTQAQTGVS